MNNIMHKELTDQILGCVFTVHNILGPGLLESAYEDWNSLKKPILKRK